MKVCALCGRCYDDSVVSCTEDGSPILSKSRDGDPEMIAGYRLDLLLESGVKGETYRARETGSGRSCLIKILSADEINSQEFLREARAATAFFHPNVVDVYEAGALDSGEFFVVAEDADAKSLRGFLNSVGVPDLLTSIDLVRQTAEALDALHGTGLVHRAINPENILLTTGPDASPLVRLQNTDVGGVIQRAIVSNKFLIDSALDSLRYFAPEQCAGGEASAQTDVYSLGVVFYEMLAGKPPFDAAKAAALIEKHRSQRPPDVWIDNFDLRMLVTHALTESLQKQTTSRQSSANLFARQMRHIQQLATHVSTPPPAGAVPRAPVRPTARPDMREKSKTAPVIESAVIVQAAQEIRKEEIQPVVAIVEHEPITVLNVESETIPIIVADAPPEVPEQLVVLPVVEVAVPEKGFSARERLSRFTLRMKAWLPKIEARVVEIPEREPTAVTEPVEVRPARVALIEALVIQAKEEIAAIPASIEQGDTRLPSVRRRSPASTRKTRLPSLRRRGPASAGGWFSPTSQEEIIPESVEPVKIADEISVIQVAPEEIATVEQVDIVAPVPEVLSKEQKTTILIGHLRLEDIASKPIKIRSEHGYARIPWVKGVLKGGSEKTIARIPRDELEEITLVRARKPIRIDLDRPTTPHGARRDKMFSFDAPDAVRFVPTLLGDSEKRRTIDLDPKDAIFSAYGGQPAARSRIGRRLLAAGGVSVALIMGFLFADDLGRLLEAASSGDSPSEKISTTEKSLSPTNLVSTAKKKNLKNSEKPQANNNEESKPVLTKDRPARSGGASLRSANRNVDNVKTKSAAEPRKGSADKKPPSTGNKPVIGTRPRVVSDPRP